jgi:hypothetical protein
MQSVLWRDAMRTLISSGFAMMALAALTAAPAAAQNTMGQMRGPFNGQYFHSGSRPYFVPFSTGAIDDDGTDAVQINPVNPAPFAPPAPPTASDPAPAAPYKPPSVEITPGGVEIVRGPGQG